MDNPHPELVQLTAPEAYARARHLRERDARYRNWGDAIVADVLRRHGPVNPEKADRAAGEIALEATSLLLSAIYDNDAELKAVRAELDAYKRMAEEALMVTPNPRFFVSASALAQVSDLAPDFAARSVPQQAASSDLES